MIIDENQFCLYQSGFAIFGIAETVDDLLAEAETWLDFPPCLAEDGTRCGPSCIQDYSEHDRPTGEVPGWLYIRRCAATLAAQVQDKGVVPFVVRADGWLDIVPEAEEVRA